MIAGLQVSLAGAEEKLTQLDSRIARRSTTVSLGMPTNADMAIRTTTSTHPQLDHHSSASSENKSELERAVSPDHESTPGA